MHYQSPIRSFFSTEKQYRLFSLLCLTTLLDLSFVGFRMVYTGFDISALDSMQAIAHTRGTTYLFLAWNLFLAWIPYLVAVSLEKIPANKILAVPALLVWLVFFPNAPYLVTDLLHVHHRHGVPLWYDVVMLFSFAWTGLLLGYLSLIEVQHFLEKRLGKQSAGKLVWLAIGLCAFGVYLGRYQRWNTWDLLLNPYQLLWDAAAVLLHPTAYLGTLGLAVVMAGILGVGYWTVKTLVGDREG